jgi:chromosome segregation and condensation protein ScpB
MADALRSLVSRLAVRLCNLATENKIHNRGRRMTKEDALKTMMLLSALESWAFSTKNLLPDYLHEELHTSMEVLSKIVLEKP